MTHAARLDFLARFLAASLLTLFLAPVFGWLAPDEKFHRIMTRTFQIVFLLVALRKPDTVAIVRMRPLEQQ